MRLDSIIKSGGLYQVQQRAKGVGMMNANATTLYTREELIEQLYKFSLLVDGQPVIVAALDTNIEIDGVGMGAIVHIGSYWIEFYRDSQVPSGHYWIITKKDWEARVLGKFSRGELVGIASDGCIYRRNHNS